MSVLREGVDCEEHGEAPPPVIQGVGSGRGGQTAASGEWPEEEEGAKGGRDRLDGGGPVDE